MGVYTSSDRASESKEHLASVRFYRNAPGVICSTRRCGFVHSAHGGDICLSVPRGRTPPSLVSARSGWFVWTTRKCHISSRCRQLRLCILSLVSRGRNSDFSSSGLPVPDCTRTAIRVGVPRTRRTPPAFHPPGGSIWWPPAKSAMGHREGAQDVLSWLLLFHMLHASRFTGWQRHNNSRRACTCLVFFHGARLGL